MEFVRVSEQSNRPDRNGRGCVPYEYEIAKCAISNEDWCEFLNAVGEKSIELGLWHKDMQGGVLGRIGRSYTSGEDAASPLFAVKPGWEKKPVTYITYTGVMRYCNWLMTGDTEKGAYDLTVTPPRRLEGATYFLPTDDEWYKAAYWDAAARRYWKYPTRSDEIPTQDQANFERGDALAVGAPYYLADVDAYADLPSPCGALQMGGNVWEFLEDCFENPLGNKLRGGSFGYTETGLSAANVDFGKYDKRCYVFGARICRMKDGWHPMTKPLKCVIIQQVWNVIARKLREKIAFLWLNLSWAVLRFLAPFLRWRGAEPSLVLVPCDPWTVIGSRGDEAMIYAVLQNYRKRHPEGKITVVTANASAANSEDCQRMQRDFGLTYVHAWRPRLQIWNVVKVIRRVRATEVFVLGADCMDGHYSPYTSTILFAVADVACRLGLKTRLTGFSWNEHPHPRAIAAAKKTTAALEMLVRDPDSLERFKSILPRARLVADTAFCLEPQFTDRVRAVLAQMESDRKVGRYVLGVNLNPMLKVDVVSVAQALNVQSNISVYLIPHDYRSGGDIAELGKLEPLLTVPHRLLSDVYSAAELKALTSGLNALFTSRMHLGIAALGMGKPIAAFAYQGKFSGLFKHFGLPQDWLVSPSDERRLDFVLKDFIARTAIVTEVVGQKLPGAFATAKSNLLGGLA